MAKKVAKTKKLTIAERLHRALDYIKAIKERDRRTPYCYRVREEQQPGKPPLVNVVTIQELYTHVQTAANLGFNTQLTASNGRLELSFIKQISSEPYGIWG